MGSSEEHVFLDPTRICASVSLLAHDLIGRMLNREVSSRPNAKEVLRKFKHPCNLCFIYMILNLSLTFPNGFQHRAPWVLFYTDCPQKAEFSNIWDTNKTAAPMIHREIVRFGYCESSSSKSSSDNSEERDECGIVDALATTITQVRISEPKRSRLFSLPNGLLPPSRNSLRT
jgi:serine/threonine protein kinase